MYRIKEELISEILEEQIIGGGVSSVSTSVNTSADVYQNTSVSYSASSFSQVSGDLPQINVIGDPFAFRKLCSTRLFNSMARLRRVFLLAHLGPQRIPKQVEVLFHAHYRARPG